MKIKASFFCVSLVLILCSCGLQNLHNRKNTVPDNSNEYTLPDYRTWKKPIETILSVDFPDHVGTFRTVYANDIAFENIFLKDSFGTISIEKKEGAIIVKETYASMEDFAAQKPLFVTVMIKDSKSPYAKNGWVYVKKKAHEKNGTYMMTQYCAGCHEAANESHPYFDGNVEDLFRDYLFLQIGE